MTADDINKLVGTPYETNGFTPDGFNCWGLVHYVLSTFYDTYLPLIPIGDPEGIRRVHLSNIATNIYEPVTYPVDGCPVLLRGGDCPHVGLWLENDGGGVLHSLEGFGVIWTPKNSLNRMGYGRRTYYRIAEHARSIRPIERPVSTDYQP